MIEVEGRIYQEAQNEYEGALTGRATIKRVSKHKVLTLADERSRPS